MNSAARPTAARPDDASALNSAVDSLRRIVRAIRLSSHTAEESLGISGAQLFVLQQLAEHPAASLGELAGRTLTHQSSVSVVVSRLVRRRLVARKTSLADGRRLELSLTVAGRALLSRAPELAQSRLIAALRQVGAGELRSLARVLDGVARLMDVGPGPPGMFFESEEIERKKPSGGHKK